MTCKCKSGCKRVIMRCKLKGWMDKGGGRGGRYYDVELKGGCKKGAICKL